MNNEELTQKMLEFIETQDGDYFDEWYASPREFASTILTDFAKYLGIGLLCRSRCGRFGACVDGWLCRMNDAL